MNKILISALCLMALAGTATSCSDDVNEFNNQQEQVHKQGLTLIAGMPGLEEENHARTEIGYDESGKLVPMWNDIVSNELKKEPDFIYAVFDGQERLYKFVVSSPCPARTATFKEVIPEGAKSLKEDLAALTEEKDIYFMRNENLEMPYDGKPMDIHQIQTTITESPSFKPGSFAPNNDILLAKPIKSSVLATVSNENPLSLQFKRLTGCIRLEIDEGEGVDLINKASLEKVILTVYKKGISIAGPNNLDVTTGTFSSKGGNATQSFLWDHTLANYLPILIPNRTDKAGYPAYLSCYPFELAEGDQMGLELLDKQYAIEPDPCISKRFTIPAGGVKIESGKITTFRITINKEDIIRSSIYVETPGTLKKEEVIEKTFPKTDYKDYYVPLVINGKLNATDIQTLHDALVESNSKYTGNIIIYLILENAQIVSDENAFYTTASGEQIKITQDNVCTKGMFEGLPCVRNLYLPNSLTKIEQGAIVNIPQVILGNSIQTIETNAIQYSSDKHIFQVQVTLKALPTVATHIADNFFVNNSSASQNIYLRAEWFEEGEHEQPTELANGNRKWKGIEWNSILKFRY